MAIAFTWYAITGRPIMAKTTFKCGRCGRSFKMKAHLARHQSAGHGAKKKTAKKKTAGKKAKKRKVRRGGRPKGIAARLGLGSMSLEQLTELIAAARSAARRKLAELQKAVK